MKNSHQDLIVFYLTNKGMYAEKTLDYYASGYFPSGLAEKLGESKVYIVDIDDPKNQDFLMGDTSKPLYAFPVDKNYTVSKFNQYKRNSIDFNQSFRNHVRMVVPYTSSEANPEILTNMRKGYPSSTFFLNDPDSMAVHNSKSALEDVRTDPEANSFNYAINPQVVITSLDDYYAFKKENPNFVLRSLRSTEGVGIYIYAPDYYNGNTDFSDAHNSTGRASIQSLLETEGELLATRYIDTTKTGDTRVYGYWDFKHNQPRTILQTAFRTAPEPSKENPCPKCNVSSGGKYEIKTITPEQEKIALRATEYYHKKHGLNAIGFDFLGNILNEINNSADAWNCVKDAPVEEKNVDAPSGDSLVINSMYYAYITAGNHYTLQLDNVINLLPHIQQQRIAEQKVLPKSIVNGR